MSLHGRSLATLFGVAAVILAPIARADGSGDAVRKECIAASEAGQMSRQSGLLRAARASFLTCGKPACPQTVRLDCTGWLEDLDKTIPSVVVRVADRRGAEILDASIWFDHEILQERLLGSAVSVDPGEHVFTAKLANGQAAEERILIHEGEKARPVLIQFPPDAVPAATGPVVTKEESAPSSKNVVVGSVLAAVGVGGLATGVFFETQQASKASTLRSECPHGCASTPSLASQVSAGKADEMGEAIAFAGGGVAVAAALYFFVARPLRSSIGTVEMAPTRSGAAARWSITF